jgi:hypothetical protein
VLRALLVTADLNAAAARTGTAGNVLDEASALARRCGFKLLLEEVERRRP